jgi:pimeloyl-ACP methyl ester carboxylesterase
MITRFSVPGGPTLGVRRWGSDTDCDVLLIHGLSACSAHYEELGSGLSPRWNIAAIDLRGHGQSDRVPGTYVIEHYARDVIALLETMAEPVVVVGHSLGGAVAVYLAGARADLVSGVFAEDPPLYHGQPSVFAATPFANVFRYLRSEMQRLQGTGPSPAAVRSYLSEQRGAGGGRWSDEVSPATIDAKVESFLACDPGVWDTAIDGTALAGWIPARPIGVPVTILRADPAMGPALTPDEAARFHEGVPHARIIEVAGAPHGIREYLPTSASYRDELTRFLESIDARACT